MKVDETPWSTQRWAFIVSISVVLHVALAGLFLQPPKGPSLKTGSRTLIARWAASDPDLLSNIGASPTRYALPDAIGNLTDTDSGLPPVNYTLPQPKIDWVFLPPNSDGSHLGMAPRTTPPRAVNQISIPNPTSPKKTNRMTSTQGQMDLFSPAQLGALQRPIAIPEWPEPSSPQPVKMEFAVNPAGEVITARVVLSSGSSSTDAASLAALLEARFLPQKKPASIDILSSTQLVWALVTFQPVPKASR
ncbi:MAG: TonB family protein [Pedosphaera sp.]|nr:TonB family protein [Pedosphaera sp.]